MESPPKPVEPLEYSAITDGWSLPIKAAILYVVVEAASSLFSSATFLLLLIVPSAFPGTVAGNPRLNLLFTVASLAVSTVLLAGGIGFLCYRTSARRILSIGAAASALLSLAQIFLFADYLFPRQPTSALIALRVSSATQQFLLGFAVPLLVLVTLEQARVKAYFTSSTA